MLPQLWQKKFLILALFLCFVIFVFVLENQIHFIDFLSLYFHFYSKTKRKKKKKERRYMCAIWWGRWPISHDSKWLYFFIGFHVDSSKLRTRWDHKDNYQSDESERYDADPKRTDSNSTMTTTQVSLWTRSLKGDRDLWFKIDGGTQLLQYPSSNWCPYGEV